ncbi:ABC transporter ATP-binding protein [Neolewinella antarctica]|uniref:Lipopolysaccharide transport system ATP-binding protein n=1 Tax=Neolewinella antarctica TaxID=442734 RepID=A0ABX0XA99_9BACT|nr:ABC transporter ATP-binding protein [Neolewinella antarctica]NJC26137.1 lipopolysaccharide transport system ATP-binding protein [Neolewinella antarctica]
MIEVQNLGKRYRLGTMERSDTLVEAVKSTLLYPIRNFRRIASRKKFSGDETGDSSILWALKDVNFSVAKGEVLGIIGHNGAGKSSLLKVLSRITEPTTGQIALQGRVSSLLEVGTGFHDDLTGRDNVYMNGTILGMTRREVEEKFEEIIAFSGVEAHIDTPVKFYSSGMKVRLAFAVAAHLDPEILIIDEVLAVGDLAFQEKCLGKMDKVAKSGRTVLFVSHNMVAVEGLCSRCLLMENGRIIFNGGVQEAIHRYRAASMNLSERQVLADRTDREGSGGVRFTEMILNEGGEVYPFQPLVIDLTLESSTNFEDLVVAVQVSKGYREVLMTINNRLQGTKLPVVKGVNKIRITLPNLSMMPGHYLLDLWAGSMVDAEDRISAAGQLYVNERDIYGSGLVPMGQYHGSFIPEACSWEAYEKVTGIGTT